MRTLTFDFDNLQGIASLYAIPSSSVYQCVQNQMTGHVSFILSDSEGIVQIPVYSGNRFKTDEVHKLVDGGDSWTVTISGIIPKRCKLNETIIKILERGEWLVVAQDANGVVTLYGSTDVPLKFTHSRTSGSSSELNGSSFTFSAIESAPSMVLSELPTLI